MRNRTALSLAADAEFPAARDHRERYGMCTRTLHELYCFAMRGAAARSAAALAAALRP
jgi:hypothetical protein